MRKYKFIIKPPLTEKLKKELIKFKKKFEAKEELTEKTGPKNAKEIGIPREIKKAFLVIEKGKEILVDVGKVNEKYFINCFSLGFDAKINDLANKLKEKYSFLPRNLSYLFSALKEIVIKIPNYEMEIKGLDLNYQGKVVLIAITNSPSYGAIFKINPGASVSDGKFNLCLIEPVGKFKALKTLFMATKGNHLKVSQVRTFPFSFPLNIFSKEPVLFEMDGEVFGPKTQFKVEILPKKLKFLV